MLNILHTFKEMIANRKKEKLIYNDAYNLWRNEYRKEPFDYIHTCLINGSIDSVR